MESLDNSFAASDALIQAMNSKAMKPRNSDTKPLSVGRRDMDYTSMAGFMLKKGYTKEQMVDSLMAMDSTLDEPHGAENIHSGFSNRSNALVIAFDSALYFYIGTPANSPKFVPNGVRIVIDSILDYEIYAPNAPYVMNLNAAALVANEITRRQTQSLEAAIISVPYQETEVKRVMRLDNFQLGFSSATLVNFIASKK
jgi:hypothetical protein